MVSSPSTRILFVPFRSGNTKNEDGPKISPQQHAARVYHRNARMKKSLSRRVPCSGQKEKPSGRSSTHSSLFRDRPDRGHLNVLAQLEDQANQLLSLRPPISRMLTGARKDPFDSYAVKNLSPYAHSVLDHALHYQWPLYSSLDAENTVEGMKKAVMKRLNHSPASFYAVMFASSVHQAYSLTGLQVPKENLLTRLSYKTRAIQCLTEEIKDMTDEPALEKLLAISILAVYGSGEKVVPSKNGTKSALQCAQHIDFYGSMKIERPHLRALFKVIEQRGGLKSIPRLGLARMISLLDVFASFKDFSIPRFPLLIPTADLMSSWPDVLDTDFLHHIMATGFRKLPAELMSHSLFTTHIPLLRNLSIRLDLYQQQNQQRSSSLFPPPTKPIEADQQHPDLVQILQARAGLIHDLLCLPEKQDFFPTESTSPLSALYSLARFATLAFILLVLFPLPRSTNISEAHDAAEQTGNAEIDIYAHLSQKLMLALDSCCTFHLWDLQQAQYQGILLWALFLGGILSKDPTQDIDNNNVRRPASLRSWFVAQGVVFYGDIARNQNKNKTGVWDGTSRRRNHAAQPVRETYVQTDSDDDDDDAKWNQFRNILVTFLWHGQECDQDGRSFWNEVRDAFHARKGGI